ncbi:transporter substrate-binding domain-containing protein [Halobacillus litoralis]|uniref:transporter substrate-binding domain-containing protein n=1 Tax=Halobacillus litoralis TaxID=45668 RepID=UPI00299E7E61|nr:transporter substrate-binding domain-containing protein [Halobacillus litoralis]
MFMLLLSLLLAACGTSESNEESSSNNESTEASDNTWSEIEEEGEIVVGTSGTLAPTSYYPEGSDELTGYDVEVMREVAERLDLDIKFEEYGTDALLPALNSGRIDAVVNDIEITKDRKEQFAFSEPYKYSYATMIVRESDLSGIETLEDVEGKVHAGGAATVHTQIAEFLGAAETKTFNATNDVYLKAVEGGKVDFIINDYYLQSSALKANSNIDVKLHPDLKFHQTNTAVVLPKDAGTMQDKINEVLQQMREEGVLTELSEKFFEGRDASKEPENVKEIEGLDL